MSDRDFMLRALELARLGRGNVRPNPMVGCVVVYNNTIIGEGYHARYGGAHAEVNAINSVSDKTLLKKSTVYVTLEPCSHFGKTPPCTDLLIKHKVKKVVIAARDSNPLVAGSGIKRLLENGIEVETGILEEESVSLNKGFFTCMERKRPYIILKWAETADGFIARGDFDSKWISSNYSRMLVHKWRTEESAIMVGTNTVHYDNPRLTARDWEGKQPLRIVIDRQRRLATNLHVFDHSYATICYNLTTDQEEENLLYVKLPKDDFFGQMLQDLYQRNIQSVLVEGGSKILMEFLEMGAWDELRLFKARKTFGEGISAPKIKGVLFSEVTLPEGDQLYIYKPRKEEGTSVLENFER